MIDRLVIPVLNSRNLFLDPKARHWEAVSREWELDKARILSAVAGGGGADMAELSLAREVSTVSRIHDSTLAGASSLSQSELSYARAVVDYNTAVAGGGLRPDLLATFASLFSEEKDPEVWGLWEYISMCEYYSDMCENNSDVISDYGVPHVSLQGRFGPNNAAAEF